MLLPCRVSFSGERLPQRAAAAAQRGAGAEMPALGDGLSLGAHPRPVCATCLESPGPRQSAWAASTLPVIWPKRREVGWRSVHVAAHRENTSSSAHLSDVGEEPFPRLCSAARLSGSMLNSIPGPRAMSQTFPRPGEEQWPLPGW